MSKAKAPETIRVYPHPDLAARGENLPGIGLDGADVDPDLAAEWIAAGLAVTTRPKVTEEG